MSTSNRPYRRRVEVLAFHPDGRLLGSKYPDTGAFGCYGGGIEEGEDIFDAGSREFIEESGHQVHNLRRLPIAPHVQEWGLPKSEHTPEQAARLKKFRGSHTTYLVGELGPAVSRPEKDQQGRAKPELHTPESVLASLADQTGPLASANTHRAKALQIAIQLRRMGHEKLSALIDAADEHMAAQHHQGNL